MNKGTYLSGVIAATLMTSAHTNEIPNWVGDVVTVTDHWGGLSNLIETGISSPNQPQGFLWSWGATTLSPSWTGPVNPNSSELCALLEANGPPVGCTTALASQTMPVPVIVRPAALTAAYQYDSGFASLSENSARYTLGLCYSNPANDPTTCESQYIGTVTSSCIQWTWQYDLCVEAQDRMEWVSASSHNGRVLSDWVNQWINGFTIYFVDINAPTLPAGGLWNRNLQLVRKWAACSRWVSAWNSGNCSIS